MKLAATRRHLSVARLIPEPVLIDSPWVLHTLPADTKMIAHRAGPEREIDQVSFIAIVGYEAGHHVVVEHGALKGKHYIITRVSWDAGEGRGSRVYMMERDRFMKKHGIGEPP